MLKTCHNQTFMNYDNSIIDLQKEKQCGHNVASMLPQMPLASIYPWSIFTMSSILFVWLFLHSILGVTVLYGKILHRYIFIPLFSHSNILASTLDALCMILVVTIKRLLE
jgi:hypothetical protein